MWPLSLCLWTSRRTSRLFSALVQTPDFFFFRTILYLTARINFGHPNGVTKVPRTRHLCKNLSLTELSENWFNNLIQPPIPAIFDLSVSSYSILGYHFFYSVPSSFSTNEHLSISVCHPAVQYLHSKKMYPISIMVHSEI